MRPHGRFAIAPIAVLALAVVAASAPRVGAQALPTARELMEKNDAAIGGRAAFDKHTSLHQKGTIAIAAMNVEGQYELFKAKPGRYVQKITLGPMGEVTQGYDGKAAWANRPGQGLILVDSAEAENSKAQADFLGNFHDMSRYKSAETVGLVDFDGRKCFKVKIVRKSGGEGFEFYDSVTGLIAGIQAMADTPMGKQETTNTFSDYKEFDGLKFPMKIVQKQPQFELVIAFATIEFDNVDPAVFEMPDKAKPPVKP